MSAFPGAPPPSNADIVSWKLPNIDDDGDEAAVGERAERRRRKRDHNVLEGGCAHRVSDNNINGE